MTTIVSVQRSEFDFSSFILVTEELTAKCMAGVYTCSGQSLFKQHPKVLPKVGRKAFSLSVTVMPKYT